MPKICVVKLHRGGSIDCIEFSGAPGLFGGRALGMALLARTASWPQPVVAFVSSGLVASGFPMANRLAACFKSPLTGTVAWAFTGGYAAASLRRAGVDALVVVGKSREPVYVRVGNGSVEVLDAGWLWGLGTFEAVRRLRHRHGDCRVLAIGPAGERGVKAANIVNDMGRASGVRHGLGAVLGEAMVKAVVIGEGTGRVEPADKSRFVEAVRTANLLIRESKLLNRETGLLAVYGTPIAVDALGPAGAVPARNYRETLVSGFEAVGGRAMYGTILMARLTCHACQVACRRDTASAGRFSFRVEGPDYAQVSSLGTNNLVLDLEAIAYLNYLSYDLGIDPIEAGNLAAMAAEAREHGMLPEGPQWGNAHDVARFIADVAGAKGIGDVFAEGALRAAEVLGARWLAVEVKGITIQNADPRAEPAWGLINAVENFGGAAHIWVYGPIVRAFGALGVGQYIRDFGDPSDAARGVARRQVEVAGLDAAQVCAFSTYAMDMGLVERAASALAGTPIDLAEVGRTTVALERTLNEGLGVTPSSDRLPRRFAEEPLPTGPHGGSTCDVGPMVEAYYEAMGWPGGWIPRGVKSSIESIVREAVAL